MQLIIDIPEQMYLNAKADLLCGGAILVDAIKNGIPYEERPQGDLISRSVVKGMISDKSIPIKFEEETRGEWQYSSGVILSDIYNVIDNAPTVEITDYDTGYQDGLEDGLNDIRPQGEWLHKEIDPFLKVHGQCSNCLQRERVGNFCRNCGADMRGEEK